MGDMGIECVAKIFISVSWSDAFFLPVKGKVVDVDAEADVVTVVVAAAAASASASTSVWIVVLPVVTTIDGGESVD